MPCLEQSLARHFDELAGCQELLVYNVKLLVAEQLGLRPNSITRIGRKSPTASINVFGAVGLRVLAGGLSEDHACLCLPGQPFPEPCLPPVSCIEHAETPCYDLVIIIIVEIEIAFSCCFVGVELSSLKWRRECTIK